MLKCNNKQIKEAYKQYLKSNYYELYQCYNNYSYFKEKAIEYCKELQYKYNGFNLKIIGFNSMTFSVGFIGEIPDEKTGEIKEAFFYITKNYDRYIFTDEL